MDESQVKKGTTTVCVVTRDAVIVAADKRVTMGSFIANKSVEKIFKITDGIAITIAGVVADAQMLVRYLKAEMSLYEMNTGQKPSLSVAANLMSNIMFGPAKSYVPFIVQLILAGVDEDGFALYCLDPSGSLIKETKFYSTGSGSPIAFGVLDSTYNEDISQKDGIALTVRAINAAMSRDSATGEGIDIIVITKTGQQKLKPEQIAAK